MKKYIIIVCFFCALISSAQDSHFSQFNISKLNLNPALTGFQENDFQGGIHRRSQWNSVADPFKTISFSFYAKDYFLNQSIGLGFVNDNSGDSNFKTSGLNISLSQVIIKNNTSTLYFGGLIGAFQRTFEMSSLIFIEDEGFIDESIFFFDLAIGGLFTKKLNNITTLETGLAAYHINNPNQSFSITSSLSTPIKYNMHFISKHIFTKKINLESSLFLSKQSSFQEFVYGIDFQYNVHHESYNNIKLSLGVYNRYNDAIIPKIGFEVSDFSVNMSYDINISDLTIATNNYGGLEFSVFYSWDFKPKESKKEFICPKYL